MVNPVLQAALRKEALARKRREQKKAQRAKEEPQEGDRDSGDAVLDVPSTSSPRDAEAELLTVSRWDTEGEAQECKSGTKVEPGAGPQSLMARAAHAEIVAFKELYGGRDKMDGGNYADRRGEMAISRKAANVPEEKEPVNERKRPSTPSPRDLDDLGSDSAGSLTLNDGSGGNEVGPAFASMPGPQRPGAEHTKRYVEVQQDDEGLEHDEGENGSQKMQDHHNREDGDILLSNKQQLFKRKMSMLQSCREVDRYEKLNRISEGTYGVVYRGRELETSTVCALKRLKLENETAGFPLTSVREINVLLALNHPNIVNVSEVVIGTRHTGDPRDDQIFMVMEYAEHDLGSLNHRFSDAEVKCLMNQLLSGVAYLHDNYVMHRDLKPANILYNNKGQLKICDFGLSRQFSSFPKDYTQMVVTLWYRAPELLLGTRKYSSAVDVWSVGCIMAQLLTGRPLLTGNGEIDQMRRTYDTLGNPPADCHLAKMPLWDKFKHIKRSEHAPRLKELLVKAGVSVTGEMLDLLTRLLDLNPETRITARDALDHPWFRCHPLPKDVALMPTFASSNEKARCTHLRA